MFCTCRNTFGVVGFSVTVQTQAGKFRYRLLPCLSLVILLLGEAMLRKLSLSFRLNSNRACEEHKETRDECEGSAK